MGLTCRFDGIRLLSPILLFKLANTKSWKYMVSTQKPKNGYNVQRLCNYHNTVLQKVQVNFIRNCPICFCYYIIILEEAGHSVEDQHFKNQVYLSVYCYFFK